eukprot:1578909-Pleurochrysis_carterae.AAC.1
MVADMVVKVLVKVLARCWRAARGACVAKLRPAAATAPSWVGADERSALHPAHLVAAYRQRSARAEHAIR